MDSRQGVQDYRADRENDIKKEDSENCPLFVLSKTLWFNVVFFVVLW